MRGNNFLGLWVVIALVAIVLVWGLVIRSDDRVQDATDNAAQQKSADKAASDEKSKSASEIPVLLRISGEQGTPYECTIESHALEDGEHVSYRSTEKGTVRAEPVEYASQALDSYTTDHIPASARCRITEGRSPTRNLKAELLVDGKGKDEDETRPDPPNKTSGQSNAVEVQWAPKCQLASEGVACG